MTITDAIEARALEAFGIWVRSLIGFSGRNGFDSCICSECDAGREIATDAISDSLADGSIDQGEYAAAAGRIIAGRSGLRF